MSEQVADSVHTVTLRFTGPQSEQMAGHFFSSWVDGNISQVWAEALDEADIAESIVYEGDEESRTLTIEVADEDDEESDAEEAETSEDEGDMTDAPERAKVA